MAERKPGPVKPPTIDLTARDASAAPERPARRSGRKPQGEAVDPIGEQMAEAVVAADADAAPMLEPDPVPQPVPPKPPEPPRRAVEPPPASAAPPWGLLGTAAVAGALLGTALTFILMAIVPGPAIPDFAPALGEQADRIATLEERLAAAETGTIDARLAVDAASSDLSGRITALEAGLAEVRASVPAPTDMTAVETRLRALSSRVDAIAAGASSADAGAIAENIGDLEQGLAALQVEIDGIGDQSQALIALQTEVTALKADLAAAEAAPPEPVVEEASATLPLIVSGLESAFATGRPYATELAGLAAEMPTAVVDERIALRAGTGLLRPDVLDQQFAAAVPVMLAARPATNTGSVESVGDWLAALLAVRPAGEVAGDSPEAVVSRLEGAMSRHDYAGAGALFAQLPPEMVAAAGAVPGEIAAHEAAAALVAELRAKAIAP